MRLVPVFTVSVVALLGTVVWAQPNPDSSTQEPARQPSIQVASIGVAAMPGGLHVAAATLAPKGTLSVYGLAGYGRRGGLLGGAHVLNRFTGSVAISYAPIEGLMIGFATDGRLDKHSGRGASEQGLVGDPRLFVRGGKTLSSVALGAQLSVLIPGKDAPSFVFPATTVEARARAANDLEALRLRLRLYA